MLAITVGFLPPRDNMFLLTCVRRPKSMNRAYAVLNSLDLTGCWHLWSLSSNRNRERGGGEKKLEGNSSLKGSWLTFSTFLIHSHSRMCPYYNQKTAFSFFFSRYKSLISKVDYTDALGSLTTYLYPCQDYLLKYVISIGRRALGMEKHYFKMNYIQL